VFLIIKREINPPRSVRNGRAVPRIGLTKRGAYQNLVTFAVVEGLL